MGPLFFITHSVRTTGISLSQLKYIEISFKISKVIVSCIQNLLNGQNDLCVQGGGGGQDNCHYVMNVWMEWDFYFIFFCFYNNS